jgi:hypothetical protein
MDETRHHQFLGRRKYVKVTDNKSHQHMPPSQQGELLALTDAVRQRIDDTRRHQFLGRWKYVRITDNINHLHMPPSQQGELLALTDAVMVGSNQRTSSLRPGEQLHNQFEFKKE